MADRKTPAVYVVEDSDFPTSVVKVATAIPAFIGCTEKAAHGGESLLGVPTRLCSFEDYTELFGGTPKCAGTFTYVPAVPPAVATVSLVDEAHYHFYSSMVLFFTNGGGECYVTSVGLFDDVRTRGGVACMDLESRCAAALDELRMEQQVTMIVVPDAVKAGPAGWKAISSQVLAHCAEMQSRIGILDVPHGERPRDHDSVTDVISGAAGFRANTGADPEFNKYGVAYYPWLNARVFVGGDVDFSWLDEPGRRALLEDLKAEADARIASLLTAVGADQVRSAHDALTAASPLYQRVMDDMLTLANVTPPSGAIAGVYATVDKEQGVFRAPANVALLGVNSPTVAITIADLDDLNVPADGKAVNAIRTIDGRGTMVWGARTLDGNSEEWRYVHQRRTCIMIEESIRLTLQKFVFHPNKAPTWASIASMIEAFLTARWEEGALAGPTAQDAFTVRVGLGSTMTSDEILDGWMVVAVTLALVHPAEFVELTFRQQVASGSA